MILQIDLRTGLRGLGYVFGFANNDVGDSVLGPHMDVTELGPTDIEGRCRHLRTAKRSPRAEQCPVAHGRCRLLRCLETTETSTIGARAIVSLTPLTMQQTIASVINIDFESSGQSVTHHGDDGILSPHGHKEWNRVFAFSGSGSSDPLADGEGNRTTVRYRAVPTAAITTYGRSDLPVVNDLQDGGFGVAAPRAM